MFESSASGGEREEKEKEEKEDEEEEEEAEAAEQSHHLTTPVAHLSIWAEMTKMRGRCVLHSSLRLQASPWGGQHFRF